VTVGVDKAVRSELKMPPGKIAPNAGSQLDGDGVHPGKTVKLSQISSDANLSGSSSLQPVSTPAKQVFTIPSEDDDEENQFYGNDKTAADDVTFKTGSLNTDDDQDKLSEDVENEVSIDENSSTYERLQVLVAQAGPVTISFFLGFTGTFTNLIFASHFISEDGSASTVFAGVSLANMFANVSCMSLLIGTKSFKH
jgi:hypothetical protein